MILIILIIGGFVSQRHNELRDMTADLLNELSGETLVHRTANRSAEIGRQC